MNAQSGSKIQYAAAGSEIIMPRIIVQAAGKTATSVNLGTFDSNTGVKVIPIYGNGANGEPWDSTTVSGAISGNNISIPAKETDGPTHYMIKYAVSTDKGAMLQNTTTVNSELYQLTLFCSMGDPCNDKLRPCYVVIPRFAPDPSMTISLDAETQEIDFNGNLNANYCDGTTALYFIYFPEEDLVVSGMSVNYEQQ